MRVHARFEIRWDELVAIEPSPAEVRAHAPALVAAYNDPKNAPLLGHTIELAETDVIEHYQRLARDGSRAFVLLRADTLAGDGDLRGIAQGAAEFAFLVSSPDAQGKGLGTRFAMMVHAFAFAQLGLERVYASVAPINVASRRVFEKLGYVADTSPTARAYAEEPDHVTLSIDSATFTQRHAAVLPEIAIAVRATNG